MIEKPLPFREAVLFLLNKNPNPQEWDSEEWSRQEPSVRIRSFISARMESARFLDRAQGLIFDYMVGTTEEVVGPNGGKHTIRRVGSRADFVKRMREFMIAEGMVKEEDFAGVNRNDLTDIRSSARLQLIFDTNVRQAYGYGKWRQGMSPAVRKAFPAMRLVRDQPVGEPRIRHAVHEGEVRLKIEIPWWSHYQNDPAIGGFDVPWGPFGFRSGMGQQDESREVAEKLGLLKDDAEPEAVPLPGLNDKLSASLKGMDPDIRRKLIDELRGGPKRESPEDAGRAAAKKARGAAMKRSWKKAVERDDHGEAERIRRLIDDEEGDFPIIVSGDRVSIASGQAKGPGGYDRFKGLTGAEMEEMAANVFAKVDAMAAKTTREGTRPGVNRIEQLASPSIELTPEERLISGSPLEILLAHDASGQLIKVQLGDRASVSIPQGLPADAFLTHNHPGGRGPSAPDLLWSFHNPGHPMRIVTVNENGETEAFRFQPVRKFSALDINIMVARYHDACRQGGDDAPARRAALELIMRDFPSMITLEREVIP